MNENIRIWLVEIATVFLIFLIILNVVATSINAYHSWIVHQSIETLRQADVSALTHNYEFQQRLMRQEKILGEIFGESQKQHQCFHQTINQMMNTIVSLIYRDSTYVPREDRQNWREDRPEGSGGIFNRGIPEAQE